MVCYTWRDFLQSSFTLPVLQSSYSPPVYLLKNLILNCFLNPLQECSILPNNSIYKETHSSTPSLEWGYSLIFIHITDQKDNKSTFLPTVIWQTKNRALVAMPLKYKDIVQYFVLSEDFFFLKVIISKQLTREEEPRNCSEDSWTMPW